MNTDETFISELRSEILDKMLVSYLDMIKGAVPDSVQDAGWRAFIEWVQASGLDGTSAARAVLRQVMCDTLAKTLAVLDGSSNLATMRGDIKIYYDGQEIHSNLTDNFWEQEEQ